MMRPASALLWALLGWTGMGALAGLDLCPLWVWLSAGALIAVLGAVDAARLWREPSPQLRRELPAVAPLGPELMVRLSLRATGRQTLRMVLHDLHPGGWAVRGMPRTLRLAPGHTLTFDYAVTPAQRGQFTFAGCHLRLGSRWRLWTQQRQLGEASVIRVYPNFAPLARMAGLSVEVASRSVGARLQRRRGEGSEFQELRDYRLGDSLRRIDWKATARRGHLISREYRDERNQQVILMLDCGRRMLAQDDRLSHFDHVLNASLALACIALRQGDAVGLLACANENTRWLPPQRGSSAMDRLLDAGYDLQALPVATDYLTAASALQARQRRRAFVVLMTNVRDEDDEELRAAVAMLSQQHLVLVVSLREQALEDAIPCADGRMESAIRSAAAMHYLARREAMHDALRREGVPLLDVHCSELSGVLIERYLAVKREGRL